MAITFLTSAKAAGNGATDATTGAIDTTGASLIVISAACYTFPEGSNIALSDSASNFYTLLTQQQGASDTNLVARLGYKFNPTTSATHTFTNSGGFPALTVAVFAGTHASAPFDQQSGADNDSASTQQPGSITPPEDDCLFVCGGGNGGSLVFNAIDSSFTLAQAQTGTSAVSMGAAIAYKIQTSAGAENPTLTLSGTSWVAAMMATFKSTGGGAAGHPTMRRWGGTPFLGGQGIGNKGPGRGWG